jgi:hypothetical protein
MPSIPLNSFEALGPVPDLLSRAASLLAGEVAKLGPLGSALPNGQSLNLGAPAAAIPGGLGQALASAAASSQVDDLRRRASALLEPLLSSLAQGYAEPNASDQGQVPLVRCAAPVTAGSAALATLRVLNEEATPADVSLYSTNFVADSGYELPSLLVSVTPRKATLPAGGHADFEIKITVSAQVPRGQYSGLIQATGCKYVKAVVLFEVL